MLKMRLCGLLLYVIILGCFGACFLTSSCNLTEAQMQMADVLSEILKQYDQRS